MKNIDLTAEIATIEGKLKAAQNFKQELNETCRAINENIAFTKMLIQQTKNLLGSVIPVKM